MMAKTYDRLLVVDFEATCWEDNRNPPKGEVSEIIQAGWCFLSLDTLEVSEPETCFCGPQRSQVSAFCTQLTGITPASLEGAPSFEVLAERLRASGKNRRVPWASWGQGDRVRLERECASWQCRFPLRAQHTDIKHLSGLARPLPFPRKDLNLAAALHAWGLEFQGCPHDAGADAVNAARILSLILSLTC